MWNAKLWLAACLALVCPGLGLPQEPDPDETYARQAEVLLERGVGLYRANDFGAAAPLFLESARLGKAEAQLQIGWHYEFGKGVPRDVGEAVRWYTRSGRQGNAIAQCNLGNVYEAGNGAREDWVEAARWCALSASQKDTIGLSALARCYLYGIGVPQNRTRAVGLYEQAAAQGDKKAAYWARHHRDPTNASFRNEEERGQYGLLPTVLPSDPVGRVFRNSAERLAYLRGDRRSGEAMAAQFHYMARLRAYENERREFDEGKRTFPPVKPMLQVVALPWEQPAAAAESTGYPEEATVKEIKAQWAAKPDQFAGGVTYAEVPFGGATLHAVRVSSRRAFRIGYSPEGQTLQGFVQQDDKAVGAVTGTFSNWKPKREPGDPPLRPAGPVVLGGKMVAPRASTIDHPARSFLGYSTKAARFFMDDVPTFDPANANKLLPFVEGLGADRGLGGLGRLLAGGKIVNQTVAMGPQQGFQEPQAGNRPNARAVAGVPHGGQALILLVQEGDSGHRTGAGLDQLARILRGLGASDAVIMDGGGSAHVVIRPPGQKMPTVNNRPHDARRLPTAILF